MTYRAFSTDTWQDPWFEKLSPQAKLLHIYLWTNGVCKQSGCYQISPSRAEFETGVPFNETIQLLAPKIEWFPDSETVWIRAFLRRQCANRSFFISAIRSLATIDKHIVDKFTQHNADLLIRYGVDTVDVPCRHGVDTVVTPSQDREYTHPSSDQFRSVQISSEKIGPDKPDPPPMQNTEKVNVGDGCEGSFPYKSLPPEKQKRRKQLPPDFILTPELISYAVENGIAQDRVGSVFDHFCDHHRAKGSKFVDWAAAWRTWVKRDRQFRPKDSNDFPGWSREDGGSSEPPRV